MTALKLTNGFKSNFFFRLKSNRKFAITCFIMHLFSLPLFLVAYIQFCCRTIDSNKLLSDTIGQVTKVENESFNILYVLIPAFVTLIAVLVGIFIAFNSFNYLYKKSDVDMYLSLPMTTRQRFFSDFLAGLVSYIVPFLITGVITIIMSFICQPLAEKAFNKNSDYLKIFQNNIPYTMFKIILFATIIMVSLYVLTVLILTLCGNLFEAILYTVLINACIPLLIVVGGKLFFGSLYGVDSTNSILTLLYRSSPVGSGICISYYFMDSVNFDSGSLVYTFWMIPYILLTALEFCLSYLIFTKRKAEQVGRSAVFKAFYNVILTIVIFIISSIFFINAGFSNCKTITIPMIIVTAIFYFIFEVAINKSFNKLWKSGIKYIITVSLIISIVFIANKTGGFGTETRVPDVDDVASISTNYHGAYDYGLMDDRDNDITFKDKEVIKCFIDFHKDVLKAYKNGDVKEKDENYYGSQDYVEHDFPVKITYNMKNGSKIIRTYPVNCEEELYKELFSVDVSDEYISKIRDSYECYSETVGNELVITSYNDIGPDLKWAQKTYIIKDKQELKALLEAYTTDLKSLTPEKYRKYLEGDYSRIYVEGIMMNMVDIKDYPETFKYIVSLEVQSEKKSKGK